MNTVPMPHLAAITHAEIQLFDNRLAGKPQPGVTGLNIKISTLTCPVEEIYRALPQLDYCPLLVPTEFRKSLTRRVSRGSLPRDVAEHLKEFSHLLPNKDAHIGLIHGTDCPVTLLMQDSTVTRLTLHLADDDLVLTDGIVRKPTASTTSAVWRAYYDPHGWWAEHQTAVREAHRRRAEAAAKTPIIAPEVKEMMQALSGHIADLRFGIAERDRTFKALTEQVSDLRRQIWSIEDGLKRIHNTQNALMKSGLPIEPAPPEPGSRAELLQKATAIAAKLRHENAHGADPEDSGDTHGGDHHDREPPAAPPMTAKQRLDERLRTGRLA